MTDDPTKTPEGVSGGPVRVFLVVDDESPELRVALRYACLRAKKSGGRVALLHVLEPEEVQHFLSVDALIREERRHEAEQRMQKLAREVNQMTGTLPVLILREGDRRDELLKLMEEDPAISILVLAAGTGGEGPGPLIAFFAGRGIARLRIPMTIVPGGLSDEQIETLT
jgi:nucleotide-binding universal stress UspA family protein